jgi:hypothetical protein
LKTQQRPSAERKNGARRSNQNHRLSTQCSLVAPPQRGVDPNYRGLIIQAFSGRKSLRTLKNEPPSAERELPRGDAAGSKGAAFGSAEAAARVESEAAVDYSAFLWSTLCVARIEDAKSRLGQNGSGGWLRGVGLHPWVSYLGFLRLTLSTARIEDATVAFGRAEAAALRDR